MKKLTQGASWSSCCAKFVSKPINRDMIERDKICLRAELAQPCLHLNRSLIYLQAQICNSACR